MKWSLRGAGNFRAVKPYPAANGRRLRPDTIFRSGELSRLDDADLEVLRRLNIRLVCDLRGSGEQRKYSSRWPGGAAHTQLDLPDRDIANATGEMRAPADGGAGSFDGAGLMTRVYRRKPAAFAGNLRLLIGAVLAGGALPLLIHCHAGKDRTGFIVAMLLTAAGVSRADVFDDYTATSQYFGTERDAIEMAAWIKATVGVTVDAAAAKPILDARPAYLQASFDEIDARWGGNDAYLAQAAGLDDTARARLRDLLLA